jgi:hypothetical protein
MEITYRFVCFNCDPNGGLVLHEHETDALPPEQVTSEYWGSISQTRHAGSVVCGACRDDIESFAMCLTCTNAIPQEGFDECSRCMEVASA